MDGEMSQVKQPGLLSGRQSTFLGRQSTFSEADQAAARVKAAEAAAAAQVQAAAAAAAAQVQAAAAAKREAAAQAAKAIRDANSGFFSPLFIPQTEAERRRSLIYRSGISSALKGIGNRLGMRTPGHPKGGSRKARKGKKTRKGRKARKGKKTRRRK